MTPTSPLPGLAAPAGEPPLIARGGARFWRVTVLALAVATKLMRVPPPAHLRVS